MAKSHEYIIPNGLLTRFDRSVLSKWAEQPIPFTGEIHLIMPEIMEGVPDETAAEALVSLLEMLNKG